MADNDKLKIVYDALINKNYELGDYNTFYTDIQDETYRKNVYDAISEHYDVGDYNAFNTKIMGAPTATGISAQQPSGQTQQSVTTSQPPLPPAGAGVWQPPYRPGLKEQVQQQQTVVPPLRPQERLPEMPSSPWSEQELRKRKDLTAYNLEAQEDAQIRRENDIPSTPAGSAEAIFTKYQDMFSLTGRGKQLTEELAGIERGVFEKYLNEYKGTDEYKALAGKRYASREEADREMNEKFMNRYGAAIEDEMRPYMETYDKELNERYGDQLDREMMQLRKQELDPQIDEMTGSVKDQARLLDDVISKRKREIIAKYRGKPGHEPMEEILGRWQFPDDLATEQEWREFRSTDRDKIRDRALLREAEDWIGETRDLVDAAINHSGFWKGVANTAGNPDTWSFGFGDLIRSRKLRETLEKADRGEELSEAEKTYLKAAVMNMAANAYYRSDLSGWYKAGETTGASLPFMLEFAVNPISASGSAVAKSLLKYGMKKFGKAAMKKGVTKATARFLGDAAAAAGMTLTTGLPGVVADTERRLAENYEYDIDENGEPVVRKTGNVGVGEALGKSVASGTIGRQSEMIFNAFGGLGGKVSGAIEKYMPGGVKRFMSEIKNSGMGRVYRNITGNPVLREAMRRTQFHGYGEEVAEEICNNLANIPLGDMTLEEATDLDTNIDILLGLAPTSLAFGMVGLGGMVRDRRQINRNLEKIRQTMDDQTRRTFDEWMRSLEDKSHDELRDAVKKVIMDKNLTPELKKEMLHAGYLIAQGKAAQDIRDGQTETERAVDDAYEEGMNTSPQEQHNVGADAESAMQALFDANEALGNIVQEMSRSDATVADLEEELTRRGATKEDALLARNAFLANARMAGVIDAAQEEADAAVDAYAKQLLPACVESEDGSRTVTTAMMNVNGQPSQVYVMDDGSASGAGMAIIMDETGKKTAVDPKSLSDLNRRTYDEMVEEYRQQMRGHAQQITEWALNHNAKTRVPETGMVFTSADNTFLMITGQVGDSWQVFPARLDPKTGAYVPVTDTQGTTMSTDEVLKAQDGYYNAVEANEKGQLPQAESPQETGEVPQQAAEETPVQEAQVQSASERIPKDEQGNLVYEQADPDTAWDAIVEQTDSDEAMAQTVADAMVADKEAELKRIGKVKMKGGLSVAEKIEVEKKRRAVIQQTEAELDHWRKIAGTANRRKQAAEAERRRVAEEAAARQKAEEERLRAERKEAERIEREALNGVPDMVDDTPQDARARGYRRVSGHKVDRQEPVQALQGKEVAVKFSDDIIPNGRVAVIDAGQLQPSHIQGVRNPLHFIDEAQPKERNDEASVLSAQRMAGNIRPEEITSSVTAYTGAPTVNMRGEVIQGNNRSSALRQMWESQPEQSARYKQYLVDHAQEFGLNAGDIAAMKRPVLVNMLDVSDAEAVTLGQYVAQDTESGGTERIRPRNVLQKMGGDIRSFANLLLKSADSDISFSGLVDSNGLEVLKWMNRKGYITPTQYKSAFDSKGNLTPEAKNDLRNIMYQDIFKGGSTRLEEMFNAMPAKAQKAILATAFRDHESPASERMIDEIQNSIVAYHLLSQDEAFAGAKNFKEARMAAENWKRQYQMDDVTGESFLPADNFSNFALLLATMYKGESQGTMQEKFNGMYDLIQGMREGSLFEQPDNTPRTLAQAIREILNIDYNGKIRNSLLADNDTAGERRGRGSGRDVGTGERIEGRDGAAVGSGRTEGDGRPSNLHGRSGEGVQRTEKYPLSAENSQSGQVEYRQIDPRFMSEQERRQRGDMLRNAPVIDVAVGQIVRTDKLSARKAAEEWWDENVSEPVFYNTEAGEVEINKKSIESSLAHRYGQAKLDAITSLIEGFENSVYLGTIPDSTRQEGTLEHYFAYPINYNGKRCYVFCRVMQDANKNRLYVHEVFVADNIRKGDALQTAAFQPHGGISFYQNILANVLFSSNSSVPAVEGLNKRLLPWERGAENVSSSTDAASASVSTGKSPLSGEQSGSASHQSKGLSSESKNNTLPSEKQANGAENSENTGIGEKIAEAEADVNTNPTDKQKEAGNYKKGHVQIGTFDITIENPKGSVRSGVDAGGKKWETTMQNTYGYMRGTEGVDGDHIDVFLSDDMDGWNGRRVFVVDQYNEDGSFDEHKVMLGFNEADEAESAYLSNYSKDWAKKHKIAVTSVSLEDFEKWIDSSHRKTKPFAEYNIVKAASGQRQADEKVTGSSLDNKDNLLNLQGNQNAEKDDTVSESVPQGKYGTEAPQNGRMEEAAAELRSRIEAAARDAQEAGRTLSERQQEELEQRTTESYAKENGVWIPMADTFNWSPLPSGNENNVYLNTDNGYVYKVNNLLNSRSILPLLERIALHNQIFPESQYELVGFTGFDGGSVYPVLRQRYVQNATFATPEGIDSYMRSLGFSRTGEAAYSNGGVTISDLYPRNVLKDADGDLYVVDADFKKQAAGEVTKEETQPHLLPKKLYDAYESGDADVIADTERAMRDFVEQGDRKQTAVTYFYSKDITRRVEDETTRKVHEFIAKTCRETLVKAGIPKQAFMSAKARRDLARQAEDPAVLDIMSADPDIEVLRTVIRNPNTSEATLRNFMEAYSNNGLDYEAQQALEQRKTRGDAENGLLFREMEDTSDRSLVAVHNLSAERLSQALELGGFPMPSIAVTKADVGHTMFGDISLVFGKESINPTDRRNKVYGEDAWTPMFPQVGYKLNDEKTSGIYRRANKAGSLPLFRPVDFHPDNYERQINGLDSESLVNHFKDDYGAKQLYLSETGNAVKEFEQHEVEKYLPDQVALNEKVLKEIGLERLKNDDYDALEGEMKRLIGQHKGIDFDGIKPFRVKVLVNNTIRHAIDYAENGNRKTEPDIEATKKKIDERINPKKFEAWLEDLFAGIVEKKGIRNNEDPFTPSGNRRKWEELYDKITLDNVVGAMRKQSERGGQGLFGGSIFGAAQEEYKSIDEIREAARERIRTMNEADYEAQRNAITDRLSAIKIPGVGNGFSDAMDMAQNIQDAVARSHTPKGIHKYLKEFYPKVTMETANEIADIVKDIQRMSARYFEAKPYRAVGFDEVRLAVVPSDTDANLVAELERRGIPVRIYEKGNEAERRQIVEEATNELNLRFRVNGGALTEEERSIVDRAKADGTYMKAPNGKPTNLTGKQWVQVRTDAFKEWFGDWEKAARVEKLRHSEPVEITGAEYKGKYELNRDSAKQWIKDDLRGEYVNRDTGEKIEIRKDGAQKVTSHSMGNEAHLKSIAVIPELIEKSIFLDEIPNEKNNGKYDSYRYYVCGLRIGSEDYTVKITVGVKGASKYYDHALTQIEKGTLIDNIDALSTTFDNNMNTSFSVKDTKLLSILQTNSSKVVDENGEPLVVFHGTPLSRNQITPNRGWHGWDYVAQEAPFHIFKGGEYSGLIFTSVDAGKARSIAETRAMSIPDDEQGNEQWTEEGYVYDLYLNSKNPFDPKDENSVRRILQSIGNEIPTLSFYGGKGDNVSPEDALKMASSGRNSWLLTETPEFLSKVKEFGYDGLVGYDEGVKYVAAFSPNQLKDAYGNNGEFSTKNDDIRFSISKAAEAVTRAREEKVTTAVSNLSGRLNVPVRVVRNVDELPAGSEARSRIEQGRNIKGWFDPSTGEVVVYLPNAFDAADAVRTVLHEAVGHRGLRELLGAQEFDRAMTDIYRQLPQDIRSEIAGSAVKDYGANIAVATEEYLARQAENNETPSWWERVVSAIRDLLRRAGISLELSGNDVKYLLWRSRKNLEQRDAVQYARDSVMRNRLDIDRGRKPLYRETAGKTVKKDRQADAAQVRSEYEKRMIASRFLLSEGYTDSMKALAEFHKLIEEETGEKIRDFENAYQAENALSSANLAQQEEFKRRHMDPIVQTLAAFVRSGVKAETVSDWLITKHGIERNREMAMRKVIADAAAKNAARRFKVAVQMRVYTGEKPMTGQEKRRELARLEAEERDKLFDVWVETKRNVWNGGYSWTEQERILNTIAQDTFGADLTQDYSGLSSRYAGSEESTFTDEAMLFVEEFEKGRETLCSQMLERVAAATGRISDKQLDGGLMDIRTREHIRDMFRYYVPLRGWSEETAEDVYNYLKTDVPVFNAPLKKMEGRTSWPDDPLPTIANMAESGIAQANRNKMKQRFLMLVENHPTDLVSVSDVYVQLDNSTDEYTVIQPQIPRNATPEEAARYMDEFRKDMEEKANKEDSGVYRASELGDIPYRVPLTSELNEHIVVVKRGGREYMLTVNGNPRLAQAVNGLTNPDNEATGGLEQALNVARSITRFMSANFTTRNPEFVASNFMRDMLYANDMVHMKESPGYAARFHTNFLRFNPRTMAGLLKKFENDTLDMNDRTEKHFRDFMLNGGETGYTSLKEISRIKKEMAKDIRDVNKVTLRKGIRLLEKKLDLCNRSVEICARFTAFVTSRDAGRSVSRSIWDAKEITVNFNKKGSGGKMIDWKREVDGKLRDKLEWKGVKIALAGSSYFRAFYAFFNASMQGVVNMFRAARRHPGRFSAMMGGTFALGMLGAWMGYDDDESGYGYLPEWTRRNNICFSAGGVGIKIPLPHIFKTFYGLGELAMSVMLGKERGDGWDVVKKAGALLSQLLPIDMYGEGGLKTLVPTAATPPLEVSWNEDWTGSPIYRENSFNEDMPEWTKAYDSTATPYVVAAKYLNKWTSGDGDGEYDKGWANINPAAMEHIVNGYLGGITTFASKLGNTIEMIWNEDKREVRNIPILNRFLWEAGPRQKEAAVKREYFENLKFMDDIRQKERGYLKKIKENGDMMEAARYQTLFHKLMHSDEYRKYLNMKEEKKVVDKLREAYGDDPTDEQNERLMLWMQRLNDMADEPYGEKEDAAKAVAR